MENKGKTLVLGASTNPSRYSYLAVSSLLKNVFPVIPMGIKKGSIKGLQIENEKPDWYWGQYHSEFSEHEIYCTDSNVKLGLELFALLDQEGYL